MSGWKPDMESILSLNGNNGNNAEDTDGSYIDGEEEGENIMDEEEEVDKNSVEDELEDGECSSPVRSQPEPATEGKPRTEYQKSPEKLFPEEIEQPEEKKSPKVGRSVRNLGSSIPKLHGNETLHKDINDMGNIDGAAELSGSGPRVMDERDNDLLNNYNRVGPSPAIGLGKRPREVRSPPSTGSMHGPPVRNFNHDFQSEESSLDLNRPMSSPGNHELRRTGDKDNPGGKSPQMVDEQQTSEHFRPGDQNLTNQGGMTTDGNNIKEEILATVLVGSKIGINLDGFQEATKVSILGEGVHNRVK
ncbi:hypothetical protein Hanom_Chr10g00927881 [Helianthus anomalus]